MRPPALWTTCSQILRHRWLCGCGPSAGILPFDNGPNGGAAVYQASANAFNITETYAQISAALAKLGGVFAQPAVTGIVGKVHSPRVEEWNFQVQRQLTNSTALVVNYVGNHSGNLPYTNAFAQCIRSVRDLSGSAGNPGDCAGSKLRAGQRRFKVAPRRITKGFRSPCANSSRTALPGISTTPGRTLWMMFRTAASSKPRRLAAGTTRAQRALDQLCAMPTTTFDMPISIDMVLTPKIKTTAISSRTYKCVCVCVCVLGGREGGGGGPKRRQALLFLLVKKKKCVCVWRGGERNSL